MRSHVTAMYICFIKMLLSFHPFCFTKYQRCDSSEIAFTMICPRYQCPHSHRLNKTKIAVHALTLSSCLVHFIISVIPLFLLLQASLRFCPSSSSVMVKSAGMAEQLPPFLRFCLPCEQPPRPPLFSRLLLSGIDSSVANHPACG